LKLTEIIAPRKRVKIILVASALPPDVRSVATPRRRVVKLFGLRPWFGFSPSGSVGLKAAPKGHSPNLKSGSTAGHSTATHPAAKPTLKWLITFQIELSR